MSDSPNPLAPWIRPETARALETRDYGKGDLLVQVREVGIEAGRLAGLQGEERASVWIPGVEIFQRNIYPQRHRGFFGELARRGEGVLGAIGLWPAQWATSTMFAGTAKGFHIHPPHIPAGEEPAAWLRRLFGEGAGLRPARQYDLEQWDVMFVTLGCAEMLLVDERPGFERRILRFWVEGDDHRGPNNVGVVIPPGVAHALRAEGGAATVVYGTSTMFLPENEGRIASSVERADLPEAWVEYLKG
jgi:dTDP-4-dehydrorhamnose 3,5-epimerase-like enzyme